MCFIIMDVSENLFLSAAVRFWNRGDAEFLRLFLNSWKSKVGKVNKKKEKKINISCFFGRDIVKLSL